MNIIDWYEKLIDWLKALCLTTITFESMFIGVHVLPQLFKLETGRDIGLLILELWIMLANLIIIMSFMRMWKEEAEERKRMNSENK